MSTVKVLVAVNVIQAIKTQNLGANVYLVDTNAYMGSGGEGTDELKTACINGDTIVWTVVSIDPNDFAPLRLCASASSSGSSAAPGARSTERSPV